MIVSWTRYKTLTLDTTSSEASVTGKLVIAQAMLEDELDRLLDNEARTETVTVKRDGRVYPKAVPITAPPSGAESVFHGRALSGVTWDTDESWSTVNPPTATITYTGGYLPFDSGSATDETRVPVRLEQAIADLAHALLSTPTGVGGATSVRVGDAAVTYATGQFTEIDRYVPGLSARVRRYRRAVV